MTVTYLQRLSSQDPQFVVAFIIFYHLYHQQYHQQYHRLSSFIIVYHQSHWD